MEIEVKYRIPSPDVADEIWKDKIYFHIEEEESREELCFDARYYDTADWDLSKNDMAYRVRREGCRWVAALKWNGTSEGALHMRREVSIPAEDDKPNPDAFSQCEVGELLKETIGNKQLICMLGTKFRRRRLRLDTGEGIYELSIDDGWIITPFGEERILEVELELFSGSKEELEQLGDAICTRYGLEKEEKSKYARGIEIIKNAQ